MAAEEYSQQLHFHEERSEELRKSKKITRWAELRWGKSEHSRAADLVHPTIGFANRVIDAFVSEIPPSGKNTIHRHNPEAIVHILDGAGYSIIDGERIGWKKGDTLFIPPMSWHQHFNSSKTKSTTYLAVTCEPLFTSMGTFIMEELKKKKTR